MEVLPVNSVVPASGLLDAVSKGMLDGAHSNLAQNYDRQNSFALWGSGPSFGMDGNMLLAWHKYGGGKELLARVYASIGANVVSFPTGPKPTQPLGWFKKRLTRPEDFKGLKIRADGIAAELFAGMGAAVIPVAEPDVVSAFDRGWVEATVSNNISSDRFLGLAKPGRVCMLSSFHGNAAPFEIIFNKSRFDGMSAKLKAVIGGASEASSADMSWKAIERYSLDYIELQKTGVKFYQTPDAILRKQVTVYDALLRKKSAADSMFKEIVESQKSFATRAVKWELDTLADRRMAFNHYFRDSALKTG
jgi:TRAP-type mannitol/chloroaromatic compound transport system substrate-binding protein